MIPKFHYFRSKKHLKNVASLPCQVCGLEQNTQAAHSNQAKHGKGRGIKASDEYTAALCFKHHFLIDQGNSLTKEERVEMWDKAHKRTVERLTEMGLWPSEIPLPHTE